MRYFNRFFRLIRNGLQALHSENRRLKIFFINSNSALVSFNPLAFWFFLLAIPLVFLFLLKNRPVRKTVSTTIIWNRVLQKQPQLWKKRPRHLLSLLIALTFLALLIFALADPSVSQKAPSVSTSSKTAPNSNDNINSREYDERQWNKNRSDKILSNNIAANKNITKESTQKESTQKENELNDNELNDNELNDNELNDIALRDVVMIFDNSASMNTKEKGKLTRFDLAQKTLDHFLVRKEKGEIAILTSGGGCQVVSGWTPASSSLLLRQKTRLIPLTKSSSQLDKALDRALELISGRANALILVLTDGGRPIPRKDHLLSDKVRFLIFGTDRDNTAITQFQPRRSVNDPRSGEIFMEITRFGKTQYSGNIEIDLNGTLLEIVPFSLKPNQTRNLIVPFLTESGGTLTARIVPEDAPLDNAIITKTNSIASPEKNKDQSEINNDHFEKNKGQSEKAEDHFEMANEDALESDNSAQAFLPNYPPLKLLLLRKPGFFLGHALKAQAFVEIELIDSVPKTVPPNSVLILEKEIPVPCPSGNIFLINPQLENDFFKTDQLQESPTAMNPRIQNNLTGPSPQYDRNNENTIIQENIGANNERQEIDSSSILRFAPLEKSPFSGAKKIILKTKENCHVLLKTAQGNPLLFLFARPQGKILVLNTNPDSGEMALTTAFPIFISNALNWFRPDEINIFSNFTPGNIGDNSNINENNSSNVNDVFDVNNLFNEDRRSDESDLSTNSAIFSALKNRIETKSLSSHSIRYWLTLVAIGLTFLEWFLYQRRWID